MSQTESTSPVDRSNTVALHQEPTIVADTSHTVHSRQDQRSRRSHSSSSSDAGIRSSPPFRKKLTRDLFIRDPSTRGPDPSNKQSLLSAVTFSWVNVLLVFNPIAWALNYSHQNAWATFVVSLLGIMPLANLLTHGTESVALYLGDASGGLLNASFGNATELIVAILLLVKCEIRVVQASLLGGLLSNLLLVLGMAFLVGGLRYSQQEFGQVAAQVNTSLLTLSVISLVIPTAFAAALEEAVSEDQERSVILKISRGSAIILILIYGLYLVFQLFTHRYLFNDQDDASVKSVSTVDEQQPVARGRSPLPATRSNSFAFGSAAQLGGFQSDHLARRVTVKRGNSLFAQGPIDAEKGRLDPPPPTRRDTSASDELETPAMNLPISFLILALATGLTYLTAEAITSSLEEVGDSSTVSKEWLGLIVLAVVANATEHLCSVLFSYRNKVDLALAVAVGSCIQIALFVIPMLILLGWIIGKPLSLLFNDIEAIVLFFSVLLVRFATEDGRANYFSGIVLIAAWTLIAYCFWYFPESSDTLFACEA